MKAIQIEMVHAHTYIVLLAADGRKNPDQQEKSSQIHSSSPLPTPLYQWGVGVGGGGVDQELQGAGNFNGTNTHFLQQFGGTARL
jgi:hypothetical protein